jgi:uncharacterized glyoxalase superfamily protein PhnB
MTTTTTGAKSTIMPALRYKNAPAAIDWLCSVLGFERHEAFPGPEDTIAHAELTLHGGMIMLGSQRKDEHARRFKSPAELGNAETCSIYVVVPDAEEVYKRVQNAKATIVRPIEDTHYGSREFAIEDLEGHTWTVGTYDPWNKPAAT